MPEDVVLFPIFRLGTRLLRTRLLGDWPFLALKAESAEDILQA